MLKYCNSCKRDLEIDNFFSYKNSTCKECVNKKVKCDYCDKKLSSTDLSKHIKQIHSTYNSSGTNDTTYDSSRTNDSTSESSRKLIVLSIDQQTLIVLLILDQNNLMIVVNTTYQIIKLFVISLTHGKIILIMIEKI